MDEKIKLLTKGDIKENFRWTLAKGIKSNNVGLYKYDKFLENINQLVSSNKAFCTISGGTRRTESEIRIKDWISDQLRHEAVVRKKLSIKKSVNLILQDFPVSRTGNKTRTITTSKTQLFLIDNSKDFITCYEKVYGKNSTLIKVVNDYPILLFEVDSLESGGRAFSGDPFTGQIAAFCKIYCTDMENKVDRKFVIYYPHQLYSQFFDNSGSVKNSKGTKIIHRLVDLVITNNGIIINPKTWEVD